MSGRRQTPNPCIHSTCYTAVRRNTSDSRRNPGEWPMGQHTTPSYAYTWYCSTSEQDTPHTAQGIKHNTLIAEHVT